MFYQNNILIEGRMVKKPELKETKNGNVYSRFSICYSGMKKRKEPNEQGFNYDFIPNFFNTTAWGKTAEKAANIEKGESVTVVGRLMNQQWTDEEGKKRQDIFILVSSIKKLSNDKNSKNKLAKDSSEKPKKEKEDAYFPEDIPF